MIKRTLANLLRLLPWCGILDTSTEKGCLYDRSEHILSKAWPLCGEHPVHSPQRPQTVIQRTDGEEFALFIPVHSILSALPESEFLSISKGIVVCRSHIVDISKDGVYTMSDGRTFQGRKRGLSSHRRLRTEIGLAGTKPQPLSMLENAACWTICRWHSV